MSKMLWGWVGLGVVLAGLGLNQGQPAARLLERPTLAPSDFEYIGSFAPPKAAVPNSEGGRWSTAYGFGGLALRRVGGRLHFFASTHVYSGGQVYEMAFPGLSKVSGQWPSAPVVREWGDVFGGRKVLLTSSDQSPCGGRDGGLANGAWTHGLFWDQGRGGLYWSYGSPYNGAGCNHPALGFSRLGAGGSSAQGPWSVRAGPGVHAQMVRGGVLRIPGWFAQAYTGGRSLGLGFGGYYSIIAQGSQGPSLFAAHDPDPRSPLLETLPLLSFPQGRKSTRNPDYVLSRDAAGGTQPSWDKNPQAGRGFWTAADTLEGAAAWIDTPQKHGLIFFPRLGHGRIGYEGGAVTWGRQQQWWYIYSPRDLAAVAQGRRRPWEVEPAHTAPADFALEYPEARVTGAAFDPVDQVLYLYVYQAYREGAELYPLVRAYRLK
ncbi:MAG: hypothetical protein SFU83_03745 [Meiothermus sp.]|nr:hypothetical protein [Meiothermus sp.]